MIAVSRAFLAFLRVSINLMLQYRGEIILWAIWGLVNPAVLYALWSAAAESKPDGHVAGYDVGQFAAYFLVIMVVGHLTTAWDTYEIGYLVRSGRMSSKLLRPILPIWEALGANLAYKIATFAFVIPMWLLFAWIVQPDFRTTWWQAGLGIIAVLNAAILNFALGYVVALIAFWSPKLDATGEVYFGVGMYFGGRLAPLAALPGAAVWIADRLPFKWMFDYPAQLLIGRIAAPADALRGLAAQLAWLLAAGVMFRFLWRAAVRRYTAVSG